MKNYSLLIKLGVVCSALVAYCTFGLMPNPSHAQGRIQKKDRTPTQGRTLTRGRSLTTKQLDAIVQPSLSQCSATGGTLEPASIIPTSDAREFPTDRIAQTMHGMWRGQVFGDYNKDLKVDYFWIIDTQRNEGLIIAQRTGNESMAELQPVANAPKITYLMCAKEGYIPSSEGGSQIHEFVKVSNGIAGASQIVEKATGVKFSQSQLTLADMWQQVVASGYFRSLPAVAFAGGLFKPMRIEQVPSAIGPSQVSMSWDSEYYGGGATQLKFTPGIPMRGVEYTTFVGTTATSGDYLVASPGNGTLAKVEADSEAACEEEACYPEYYDLAFDAVTMGPLQEATVQQSTVLASSKSSKRPRSQQRTTNRKLNQHKRN